MTVSGLQTLTLNGTPLKFPSVSRYKNNGNVSTVASRATWEALTPGLMPSVRTNYKRRRIPRFSNIVNVANTSSTMTLGGGGIVTVNVYPLILPNIYPPSTVTPIHTYSIDLSQISSSSGNLHVPGYSQRPYFGSIRATTSITASWTNGVPMDRYDMLFLGHNGFVNYDANSESVTLPVDTFNDTVVSMVPSTAYGDYRMLADTNYPAAQTLSFRTLIIPPRITWPTVSNILAVD